MLVMKMKSILIALICKKCMYKTHKKSETLIMPDFEPNLRDELIAGSFFKKRCPCCENVIDFVHQVLYVDKDHKFILLIKPKSDYKDEDHNLFTEHGKCKKRYLSNTEDVAEKILILENLLDDRVVEILKAKLLLRAKHKQNNVQAIRYYDIDQQSATIWFTVIADGNHEFIAVTMESYNLVRNTLPDEDYQCFKEINTIWGNMYL